MKLKLTVNGKVYEVDVEVSEPDQPHPSYVPPAGQAASSASSAATSASAASASGASASGPVADESKVCRSPISGVLVRVKAQPGQAIQVNDELMVLEAMKMETVITSPIAGTVKKVNGAVGDAVKGGQVLVEFE